MPATREKTPETKRREFRIRKDLSIRLDLFAVMTERDATEVLEAILMDRLPPLPREYSAAAG